MQIKSDVVVVGAGPAGSTTARLIAKNGFNVVLVEKDEYPGKTNVCAGGMPKSVIKDTGLNSNVIEKKITGERHYFPWGLKIGKLEHVTVYRNVFDRSLADKAVDDGAKMLTNTLIKEISVKSDGVCISSKESSIKSKIIVFADGPNTLAYKKFGIGFKPEQDKTIVSAACEVEWENNPLDEFEFYYGYDIAPWGYGWIFPRKNTVNVGVGCLYSEINSNIMESLNYLLRKHPLTHERLKGRKIVLLSSATIPIAPAKRMFGERMLVVGDAAGMVDPVTGGGIDHAVNGGKVAGEICVAALEKEDFSAKFLSQYQAIWHKTEDYSYIYSKFLLSNAFLYYSKFDKNAFPKLTTITQAGIRNIFKSLTFIYGH